MEQRVPQRAWQAPGRPGSRPRVLVEDDSPALAISDFAAFEQAGFDVAWCRGPGAELACPLLLGHRCDVLASADVVLHGLDGGLGIAATARRRHPGTPVLVRMVAGPDGSVPDVPRGCQPLLATCSVHGQVEALRRAVERR